MEQVERTLSHSLRERAVKALGTLALTLVAMSTTRGSPARLVFWRRREVEDVGRLRDDEPNRFKNRTRTVRGAHDDRQDLET
jgi:hypothetical protein